MIYGWDTEDKKLPRTEGAEQWVHIKQDKLADLVMQYSARYCAKAFMTVQL